MSVTTTSKPKKRVARKVATPKPIVPALPLEPKSRRADPSLKLYRRIAVSFVLATCLLLVGVVYLSFASATIRVTTEAQAVSISEDFDIVEVPSTDGQAQGQVLSTIFEQAKTFTLENDGGEVVEEKAGGMVTIYNTNLSNQMLVATTRLLSPDGLLFRLDETVNVPASGSVNVTAHADFIGKGGEIGPTTFTIPGLNESLQKKIYAQSTEAFTGGEVTVQMLTQEELDAFALQLEQEILDVAKTQLFTQAGSPSGAVYETFVIERKSDTEPGAETGLVTLSLRVRVVGVFFDKEEVWESVQEALLVVVPEDLELEATSSDLLQLTIEDLDADAGTASIKASVDAPAHLSEMSALLDKSRFVGKSVGAVVEELESYDLITEVDVTVTPFWLKRLPSLPDHIKVEVE